MNTKILLGFLIALASLELRASEEVDSSRYIRPCNSWIYNSEVRGYVCSFYDQVEVLTYQDLRDLEYANRTLQQKITQLESRVRALENKPSPTE